MERRDRQLILTLFVCFAAWLVLMAGWVAWGLWTLAARIDQVRTEQTTLLERLEAVEQAVEELASRLSEAHEVAEVMRRLGSPADYRQRLAMALAVMAAAERHGVPVELVLAVGAVESNWRPYVVGPKGERGPLQVLPSTFGYLGMDCSDLACEIEAGVRYLAMQVHRSSRVAVAIARYHAGHNLSSDRALRRAKTYVRRVERAYRVVREVQA